MAMLNSNQVPESTDFMPLMAVKDEPLSEGGKLLEKFIKYPYIFVLRRVNVKAHNRYYPL